MRTFNLVRSGKSEILFKGYPIASVRSVGTVGHPFYSGSENRWHELTIYVTAQGRFVCSKVCKTRVDGEWDHFDGRICNDHREVKDFFGKGWLEKNLYKAAKIDELD